MAKEQTDRVNFRKNPDNIVTLSVGSVGELNDLVYDSAFRAASSACSNLYYGLTRAFLDRFDEDHTILINEMEQIRIRLNALGSDNDD